jgi:hypothetical protein
MLGDGGMGDALLQRREYEKQHVNAAFYSSLLLAAVIYLAVFITGTLGCRILSSAGAHIFTQNIRFYFPVCRHVLCFICIACRKNLHSKRSLSPTVLCCCCQTCWE